MDRLLVDGYVRTIENSLQDKIIPIDVYCICFDFYFSTKFIFYLASIEDDFSGIQNTMSVTNLDSKRQWNCNLTQFNTESATDRQWIVDNAGICFARNLKLPPKVHTSFNANLKFNYAVFQCGGMPQSTELFNREPVTDCNAFIIDSHHFQQHDQTDIAIHHWTLPPFAKQTAYNYALYSSVHDALFSVGGADRSNESEEYDSIQKLSFAQHAHDDDMKVQQDWKWQPLPVKLSEAKSGICATFLDSAHNKLLVAGGYTEDASEQLDRVEIIDLLSNKATKDVKALNMTRMDGGIFYDEMTDICYVGGGYNEDESAQHSVECFSCSKNVCWFSLPETSLAHDMNPLLWMEEGNLLHIMSIKGNGIERMDLREGKEWSVVSDGLEGEFNVKFDVDNVTRSRIVGN